MLLIKPHHIIAIGASAGGMEEIISFFDHTPLDGVSYVVVQHLSPDYKSRMVELIAKHSKLVVKEAVNAMNIESNEVYLIPNSKFMTVQDGRLYLTAKDDVRSPHLTVNVFFKSLAANSGKKAIGIILSGLGSDGIEGVKAIKEMGGMIIARNPETTEYSSMPSNAIATGLVDFVLEPAEMPLAIEQYVKQEGELIPDTKDDEKNIAAIIDVIRQQLPLDFTHYKQTTILRRIKRRASYNNFTGLDKYFEFLKTKPEEVEALAKDFLISVTSFFRDKEAYTCIEQEILPDIFKRLQQNEELKIWVAGCATGEEAYSLAILVHEQLRGLFKDTVVKIFATDIDAAALAHARKGVYNGDIIKDIPAERLKKYFIQEGNNYTVKTDVRRLVIFAQHDLVMNPPYCNMHFISCRNVLIYMTPLLQKKIFLMLLFGLKTDGCLFLGSSEKPAPILKKLEVINKKWKIYKNLEINRAVRFDAFSLPALQDSKYTPLLTTREGALPNIGHALAEAVNASLIEKTGYLVVCVDENNQVVKSYGDTTKYLLQKNFTLNLTELLPRQLAVAYSTLKTSVSTTNAQAAINSIMIKRGDAATKVNLSVAPLLVKKGAGKLLMVVIGDDIINAAQQDALVFDEQVFINQHTINLEAEVAELREELQSTHEKLDASNENMQSFNEELLSANEEMQSTNEEMQSVNEELHTINADYQLKNKELLEINDDLDNYFKSNINGQLFVNNDLVLMKFSPGTVKQINLLPADVGRPLSNISTNIKLETITEDIKQVIAERSVVTKEIETNNGKWYQIMTMPYIKQMDNKVNGAIITFNDITELKKTQLELDKKNESLLRINEDLDNFVHTASHDLLGPLGNIEVSIDVMNNIQVINQDMHPFLDVIKSSIKKFRALINDIAHVGKVESGMIAMESIDIGEVLTNIEWSLDHKIKLTGTVINRNLHVKHIHFSKKNIRSILYNLVSNGIKFKGDRTPVIAISTHKEQDHIVLSVQDNGIGMANEDLDTIFAIYGRLSHYIEGQGIGLYLAKKIVDAAGGKITVESKPGKGTRFSIYFKAEPKI